MTRPQWEDDKGLDLSAENIVAMENLIYAAIEARVAKDTLAVNAADHGLKLDGTDDGPALNTLIEQQAAALGSGTGHESVIYIPPGKTLGIGTQIVRRPFVSIVGNGAHIRLLSTFAGSSAFTNKANEGFARSDVRGFTIDKNLLEGILFDCHSMQYSRIEVARMLGGGENCTNLSLKCDATVGVGGELKSNTVYNVIDMVDNGVCGYAGTFAGQSLTGVPGGEGPAVVTLNDFPRFIARNVMKGGLDFIEWADDNTFGLTALAPKGENSFGVRMNGSATPAANVGVYSNHFNLLTSEHYGTAKKRRGIILNFSYDTTVGRFFPEPLGPEGAAIANEHSQSHDILIVAQEGNTVMRRVLTPQEIKEVGSVPTTPSPETYKMYMKEKKLYVITSNGTIHEVTASPAF